MSNPSAQEPENKTNRWIFGGLVGSLCLAGITASSNQNLMTENRSQDQVIAKREATIVVLEGDKAGLQTQLAAKTAESESRHKEIVSLTTSLAETQKKLEDEMTAHNGTKELLVAATRDIEGLKGNLADANRKIEGLTGDLKASGEREMLQKNTIASLEKTKGELTAAIDSNKKQIANLEADKTSLQDQIGVAQRLEAALRADILAGVNREAGMVKTVVTTGEKIAQMDQGISELNKALAEKEQANTALAQNNETIAKDLAAAKTAVEQLTGARDDLNKKIDELNKQIQALQEQDKAKESAMIQMESQKNKSLEEAKQLATSVDQLTKERDALKVEREQLSNACSELMTKLQELSKQVQTLQEDFVSLRKIREEADQSILSTTGNQ